MSPTTPAPASRGRRLAELGLVGGVVGLAATLVVVGYRQEQASVTTVSAASGAEIVVEQDPADEPLATVPAQPVSSVAAPILATVAPPTLGDDFSPPVINLFPRGVFMSPTTQPAATTTTTETVASTTTTTAAPASEAPDDGPVIDSVDMPGDDAKLAEAVTPVDAEAADVAPQLAPRNNVPRVLFGDMAVDGPVIGTVAIEGLLNDSAAADELVDLVVEVFGAERVIDNSAVVPGTAADALATIRISEIALFETKSPTIDASVLPMLERIVVLMKLAPDSTITVIGHTDTLGVPEENDELSRLRAESVVNYLEFRSISPDRLVSVGAGSSEPIASNDDEAGRSQNRRIELIIEGPITQTTEGDAAQ